MTPIPAQQDRYWARVAEALAILRARPALADSLRRDIDRLPAKEQALFYHAEPFDIAKDLAGIQGWPEEALREYARSATSTRDDVLRSKVIPSTPVITNTARHAWQTWLMAAGAAIAVVALFAQTLVLTRTVTQLDGSLESARSAVQKLQLHNATMQEKAAEDERRIEALRARLAAVESTRPNDSAPVSRPAVLRFALLGDRASPALQLTASIDNAIPLWLTLPDLPNDVAFDVEIRGSDRKVIWRTPTALKPTVVPGVRGDVALIEVLLPPRSLRAGETYDVRWSTQDTDPPLTLQARIETRR